MKRSWSLVRRLAIPIALAASLGTLLLVLFGTRIASRERSIAQVVSLTTRFQSHALGDSELNSIARNAGSLQTRIHDIVMNPSLDPPAKARSLNNLLPEASLLGDSLKLLDLEAQGQVMIKMLELFPELQQTLVAVGSQAQNLASTHGEFDQAYKQLNRSLSPTPQKADGP